MGNQANDDDNTFGPKDKVTVQDNGHIINLFYEDDMRVSISFAHNELVVYNEDSAEPEAVVPILEGDK